MKTLLVRGPEAKDFLHRLTSINLQQLAVGQVTSGLLLDGTAKLQAVFYCVCIAENTYLLLSEQLTNLQEKLEFMHFGEKLTIEPASYRGSFVLASEMQREWAWQQIRPFINEDKKICFAHEVPETFVVLSEKVGDAKTDQTISSNQVDSGFEARRIAAKVPAFGKEYELGDLCINVGLLNWIHRDKGCYPGQEVVEKALNLGHPAKVLVKVHGEQNEGDELSLEDKPMGAISSSHADYGLAVVRWKASSVGTSLALNSGKKVTVV